MPARLLGFEYAALDGAAALGLCLVPALATLLAMQWLPLGDQGRVLVALAGAPVRMAVVLGGAWALSAFVPEFHGRTGFWIWVFAFYMFTLAVETWLLVGGRGRAAELAGIGSAG